MHYYTSKSVRLAKVPHISIYGTLAKVPDIAISGTLANLWTLTINYLMISKWSQVTLKWSHMFPYDD